MSAGCVKNSRLGNCRGSSFAERPEVVGGRAVILVERDEDLPFRWRNRDVVAQRQVDVVRHADVVADHVDLAGRYHLTDVVFDLLEIDLRLLDPRARRAPHVQAELSRVDSREEVTADEREQRHRQDREREEPRHRPLAVLEHPVKCAFVGIAEPEEGGFKATRDAVEQGTTLLAARQRFPCPYFGGHQVPEHRRDQRAREEIAGEHREHD